MASNTMYLPPTALAMKILRTLRSKRPPGLPSALFDAARIRCLACFRAPLERIESQLEELRGQGLVERLSEPGGFFMWALSRAAVQIMEQDEAEAAAALDAEAKAEPMSVTVCNSVEPDDREPAHALLCVDEDELYDWWDALDVEAKAEAFVQWSLGNDGCNSHINIEPRTVSVPIVGTANCTGEASKEARNG